VGDLAGSSSAVCALPQWSDPVKETSLTPGAPSPLPEQPATLEALRLAYADPPYPGRAHLYEDHPDFAGEVDHVALIEQLGGYDGWALSTSAEALHWILPLCPPEHRVIAWVKHTVTVSWEPVIVVSARTAASRARLDSG
jgi:hypothetical protein